MKIRQNYLGIVLLVCVLPLIARENITASVSTVGWREKSLEVTVKSMLPQVDRLNVFLQKYEQVPDFLDHPKITVAVGNDYPDALVLGDAAKFFWADRVEGYHFILDDDIIYPSDYVSYCISKIEQYGRKAVVGFHGSIFKEKVSHYAKDRTVFSFTNANSIDRPVHMLGTGVLAYHTDTIKVNIRDFLIRNMADIWFAILGQKQKVPFIALQKAKNYIISVPGTGVEPQSIWGQSVNNYSVQVGLVNQYQPWQIFNVS